MVMHEMLGVDVALLLQLPGRIFFYPSAGRDWSEPLNWLGSGIDEFRFVDICYQFDNASPIPIPGWEPVADSGVLKGPRLSRMTTRPDADGNTYRHIEPGWLSHVYRCKCDSRVILVTQRRGFGEYALHELPDASLGVFWHRGDSSGEGGSNSWYLANRRRRHPPLNKLFDVLKRKLAYPALIASDGSNTNFTELREAARCLQCPPSVFEKYGLIWQRVGSIRNTILWLVEPQNAKESAIYSSL